MLPLLGLLLVVAYVFLVRSGFLDELADSLQKRRPGWPPRHPGMDPASPPDEESSRRLEVFEDFIEGLDPNPDDERE